MHADDRGVDVAAGGKLDVLQDQVRVDREPVRLPHRDAADLAADDGVVADREVVEEGRAAAAHVGFVIGQVDAMARRVVGVDRVAADRDVAQRRAAVVVELHAVRVQSPARRVQADVVVREEGVMHPADDHGVPGRARDVVALDRQAGDRGKFDRRRETGEVIVLQGEIVCVVHEHADRALRGRTAEAGISDGDARRTGDHDALAALRELEVDPIEDQVRSISKLDAGKGHVRSRGLGNHSIVEVTASRIEIVRTTSQLDRRTVTRCLQSRQ